MHFVGKDDEEVEHFEMADHDSGVLKAVGSDLLTRRTSTVANASAAG